MSRKLIAGALALSLGSGSFALAQYAEPTPYNTAQANHMTTKPNTDPNSAAKIKKSANQDSYQPNTITKAPAPNAAEGVPKQGNQPIGN